MRKLRFTVSFERAYRKCVRGDVALKKKVDSAIQQLEADAFASSLQTHKLGGKLQGLFACSCGYDCRIVFAIITDVTTEKEIILLVDIGTHDEVY